MNKNKIILLFAILISGLVSSQIKKDLKQYKIKQGLMKYGIKLNNYVLKNEFVIKDYNEGYTVTNYTDSIILKKVRVSDKKDFFIYTYKYTPTNYKQNHNEYFIINETKFLIDSIIDRDKIDLKYNNPYFNFRESYFFKEKKKDKFLIVLEAENRTFYRDKFVKSYFVINIYADKQDIYLFYDVDKSKVLKPL
ncbi:MAG: hypothetical protein ABI892_20075 [Flavobacterium sp.]